MTIIILDFESTQVVSLIQTSLASRSEFNLSLQLREQV